MRSPGFYGSVPLTALQGGAGRTFVAGRYYGPMMGTNDTTAGLTQGTEYAVRFEVGQTTTFDRIGLEVTTGVATAVVRLGIRNDLNGNPDTLLLDAGTIDAAGTAYGEITISQVLTPGRWWLTATLQVTTGVSVRIRNNDPMIGQNTTATANMAAITATGRTGALPAAFSAASMSAIGPKVLLRAA